MSEENCGKLQYIQDILAYVIRGTRRYDHVKQEVIHITSVLAKLHWLLVKARVTFKLATLVYNIHQTSSPPYLASLLSDCKPVRYLWSLVKHLLEATASRLKTSERAFRHAVLAVWNTLTLTVKECGKVRILENIWKLICTSTPTEVSELLPRTYEFINSYAFFFVAYSNEASVASRTSRPLNYLFSTLLRAVWRPVFGGVKSCFTNDSHVERGLPFGCLHDCGTVHGECTCWGGPPFEPHDQIKSGSALRLFCSMVVERCDAESLLVIWLDQRTPKMRLKHNWSNASNPVNVRLGNSLGSIYRAVGLMQMS